MKPSKSIQISIITALIFIALLIISYFWFIRPMYINNVDQTRTVLLDSSQEVCFGKHPDQEGIYGIELEITGKAHSNIDIIISDKEGVQHIAGAKGKQLEFTYKNDWYSDSCYIEIIPRGAAGGKVEINCRFLGKE